MKILIYLNILFLTSNIAFGQFIPVPSYSGSINQNGGYYTPFYGGTNPKDIRYRLLVTYLDGHIDTVISKFYTTKKHFQVYIKDDERKIYPNETKNILARKKKLIGLSYDSLWLFCVHTGKLNTYYYLPDTTTNIYNYIQKGNGPLEMFSEQKFKSMISDNPDALKFYKMKKISPYLGFGLFASGGIILAIVGANGGHNDAMVIQGLTISLIGVPFIFLGQNRISKTTGIYNE